MTRHLQSVESPRGPWFLSTRAEIDAWAAERHRTLMALVDAERCGEASQDEPAQLELGEAA